MALPSEDGAKVPRFGSFKARQPNLKTDMQSTKRETPRIKLQKQNDSIGRDSDRELPLRHSQRSPKQEEWHMRSDLFFSDIRGDPGNIQFGGLHKGNIPLYRRAGSGSVIGAAPHIKIDTQTSTDKVIVFRNTAPDLTRRKVTPLNGASNDLLSSSTYSNTMSESPSVPANSHPHQAFMRLKASSGASPIKVGSGIWDFIEKGSESEGE